MLNLERMSTSRQSTMDGTLVANPLTGGEGEEEEEKATQLSEVNLPTKTLK